MYGLVTNNHGAVLVSCPASGGTCIEISFPRANAPETLAPGLPGTKVAADAGPRTVLVVEDDERVRRLVTGVLSRAGFRILSAGSGADVIARWGDGERPCDLLLTDFHLPGIDGFELYEELRRRWSGLAVLFMSGFVDDDVFRTSILARFDFLQKPFTPAELLATVRSIVFKRGASVGRRRILVIDDEEAARSRLSALLESLGYDCLTASDGQEALQTLERIQVDAVISDMVMPNLDGIEVCSEIRKRYPDVRIIAMSGQPGGRAHLEAAEKLGAAAKLAKPFSKDELSLALEVALHRDASSPAA